MTRPIEALISVANLQHNFSEARRLAPNARVMAVVKANAYGHGAIQVVEALSSLADAFGVASLEEAIELRDAGIDSPIVLLSGVFGRAEMHQVARYGLATVIHCEQQLQLFLSTDLKAPVDVWLKLDTGMHRLGFNANGFSQATARLRSAKKLGNLVFMSHLACADEPASALNNSQLSVFHRTLDGLCVAPGESLSLANSAALLTRPDMHFDWVRTGVLLYGVNPLGSSKAVAIPRVESADESTSVAVALRPVMTLRSRIVSIQPVAEGEAVGYGQAWRASAPARIAVVAVGYGDGYSRHAGNGTPVLVNGKRATLAGRVSMDLTTVDVSAIPEAKLGDEVTLWGEGLAVETVAEHSATIAYELLTGVNQRVKFRYL